MNIIHLLLISGLIYVAVKQKSEESRNVILIVTGLLAVCMINKEGVTVAPPPPSGTLGRLANWLFLATVAEDSPPPSGTPSSGTPSSETPSSGTPSSGTPSSGTSPSGTPSSETPPSKTPSPSPSSCELSPDGGDTDTCGDDWANWEWKIDPSDDDDSKLCFKNETLPDAFCTTDGWTGWQIAGVVLIVFAIIIGGGVYAARSSAARSPAARSPASE